MRIIQIFHPKKKFSCFAILFGFLILSVPMFDLSIYPIEYFHPTNFLSERPFPAAVKNWTVMVYVNADNELDPYGIADLNEMETAGSTDNVNIICIIDRAASGAKTYQVNQDSTSLIVSTLLITGISSEPSMGSKSTLKNFMTYVFENFPAEKNALILWGQGGNITNVSYDETSKDHLSINEVEDAISESTSAAGKQINLLGFDVSLMGTLEVGYQLSNASVDLIVFSQEAEPSEKWPYDRIFGGNSFTGLIQNPEWNASQLGSHIVDVYNESYSGLGKITQSLVNTSSLSSLATNLNNFAQELNASINTSFLDLVDARDNSQQYNYTEFIDLWDFAEQIRIRDISPELTSAATIIKSSVEAAVIISKHGTGLSVSEGLSIYFPPNTSGFSNNSLAGLKLIEDTYWDDFLANYFTTDQNNPWVIAPANITLQQGDVANITWQLGDLISPKEFKLFCNDVLFLNRTYNLTDVVSVKVNTSKIGVFIYTINVTDRFGHWNFSQVRVIVQMRTFGIYVENNTIDQRESNDIWIDLNLISPDILFLSKFDSITGVPEGINDKLIIMVYNITLTKLENLNNATIRFYYSNISQNFIETSLTVYSLNTQTEIWEEIPSSLNTDEKYIEIKVNHFSIFAVMGIPAEGGNSTNTGNTSPWEWKYVVPIIAASIAILFFIIIKRLKLKKIRAGII